MNTFHDLSDEFTRLSGDAPDDAGLRSAVSAGVIKREKRRRTAALVGVAAAVVLVAGGVAVTRALTTPAPNSTRPAAPSPVVDVPEVPLSAGTQLIRHQLQPVTSPVTVVVPQGLTGTYWGQTVDALYASWARPMPSSGQVDGNELLTVGYVVSESDDLEPYVVDQRGVTPVTLTRTPITVGGHPAELLEGPQGTTDKSGFPAAQRISWQLTNGRYIQVWIQGLDGDVAAARQALQDFAASVTEQPTVLARTIGIGLTLPGLVNDISTNVSEIGPGAAGSVLLCPEGVDPYARPASASGSGTTQGSSESPPDSMTVSGSASAGPGETTTQVTQDPDNPLTRCITVFVVNAVSISSDLTSDGLTPVTVAGTTVQVDTASNSARVTLDSGMFVAVAAPPATPLSAEDLAALTASVALSPDVKISDSTMYSSAFAVSSAEEPASSVGISSSAVMTAAPDLPVSVLRDADHPVGVGPAPSELGPESGERLGTISFFIRNVADDPVSIDAISLGNGTVTSGGPFLVNGDAGSLTLHGARARLDTVPSDAATPMTEVTAPMLLAPGSTVRFELDFAVGACAELPADPVLLMLDYSMTTSDGSSSGGFSLDGELGLPSWVHDLTQEACGH